jgi:hypothetical protein
MSEDLKSTVREISHAALTDSNVRVGIINVDQQKDHAATKYLRFWNITRSLVLPISTSNKGFKETAKSTAESVVSSPKRDEILRHIAKAFCIVLLIQGKDKAENKRVQEIAATAIDDITKVMGQMGKAYDYAPRLVVMKPELFPHEKILLWSLGVNEREIGKPYIAVLYGKGKQIGPLFKPEIITKRRLFNVLSMVGADCSCTLDTNWARGLKIPLTWGGKIQSELVGLLGFDTENPMVKIRVSQIISRGPAEKSIEESLEDTLLYGYSESVVEFDKTPNPSLIPPIEPSKPRAARELASPQTGSSFWIVVFSIGGMVLVCLGGGLFIMLKARKRDF